MGEAEISYFLVWLLDPAIGVAILNSTSLKAPLDLKISSLKSDLGTEVSISAKVILWSIIIFINTCLNVPGSSSSLIY